MKFDNMMMIAAIAILAVLALTGLLVARMISRKTWDKRADQVDAVAEAEVFLAYNKTGKARNLLQAAVRIEPDNIEAQFLLLKIYAQDNDKRAYEKVARSLHPLLIDTQLMQWERVARLGRKLDPNNDLYQPTVTQQMNQA